MKWLMPLVRALSCWLPLRTKTLTAAVAMCGNRRTTTRTPLSSVVTDVSASICSMQLRDNAGSLSTCIIVKAAGSFLAHIGKQR